MILRNKWIRATDAWRRLLFASTRSQRDSSHITQPLSCRCWKCSLAVWGMTAVSLATTRPGTALISSLGSATEGLSWLYYDRCISRSMGALSGFADVLLRSVGPTFSGILSSAVAELPISVGSSHLLWFLHFHRKRIDQSACDRIAA